MKTRSSYEIRLKANIPDNGRNLSVNDFRKDHTKDGLLVKIERRQVEELTEKKLKNSI